MSSPNTYPRILAITYSSSDLAADILRRLAARLTSGGTSCAGFIQRDEPPRPGRSRCDMIIECLSTGERLKISEDRGPLARGCRLDVSVLATALVRARTAIRNGPDVLIINKFGKTEAEGGGFRPLIADAFELGIPVLVAVPWRNIESWRDFAGDLSTELEAETLADTSEDAVLARIGLAPEASSDTMFQTPAETAVSEASARS